MGESYEYTTYSIDNLLKEEYKGHSLSFWQEIQKFHDNDNNWDNQGLSEFGKTLYNELRKRYENKN